MTQSSEATANNNASIADVLSQLNGSTAANNSGNGVDIEEVMSELPAVGSALSTEADATAISVAAISVEETNASAGLTEISSSTQSTGGAAWLLLAIMGLFGAWQIRKSKLLPQWLR